MLNSKNEFESENIVKSFYAEFESIFIFLECIIRIIIFQI